MLVFVFFAFFCVTCFAENTILRNLGTLLDLVEYTQRENILTSPEVISNYGYTAEIHTVTTDDGYILEMHRIPAASSNSAACDTSVVFLMHGIATSSMDWILMGPNASWAFVLADAGYDVWMGNARGNIYSSGHEQRPNISEETYWGFSWHEIGYYDLPVMIDHALETTGCKQLIYIGHSQGTTAFYVMASLRSDYNKKIEVMISLAPIGFMNHADTVFKQWAVLFADVAPIIIQLTHFYYIPPATQLTTALTTILCNDKASTHGLCTALLFSVIGTDEEHTNTSLWPIILSHSPAGASTMQFVHYMQVMKSGRFCHYDYGLLGNLAKYGAPLPPSYDLGRITAPVILIYSKHDSLSSEQDVHRLYNELGNGVAMNCVNQSTFSHFAFLMGANANKLIFDPIKELIRNDYP